MFKGKAQFAAIALIALLSALAVPVFFSEQSDAATTTVVDFNDGIKVNADDTATFYIRIANNNPYLDDDKSNDIYVGVTSEVLDSNGKTYKYVSVSCSAISESDVKSFGSMAYLEGNKTATFVMTADADRFASQGDYSLKYTYKVYDCDGALIEEGEKTHELHVGSNLSTSDTYNKFLGAFPNEFDGTLGSVWFTLVVTIVAWFLIGILVMFVAVPIITFLMTKKDDPDRPILRKSLIRWCLIVILVFTAVNSLYVIGVDEHLIDSVKTWAHLIYLIVGLFIAWRIYKTFLERITDHMRGRDMVAGGEVQDFDSFKPLFLYIGEIVIALIGVVVGLGMLHVDLAAIITSAGVVSLGITLGAQQVLSQFFSGLVILSTRPFRKGDLIQLGTNTVVTYRVRKVNVMNTELENWDNSDVTIVPNNVITSSNVKNITRDTLRCKVHLFVDVSYKTNLALARSLLLEVANAHPRVIKDGSVAKPSTRVTDFMDSNITLRLTVWVDDYNDHGAIAGDLRVSIFNKFNENGINIDYPQVVLHMADPQNARDTGTAAE